MLAFYLEKGRVYCTYSVFVCVCVCVVNVIVLIVIYIFLIESYCEYFCIAQVIFGHFKDYHVMLARV